MLCLVACAARPSPRPASRPVDASPQPPLRALLDHLLDSGFPGVKGSTVFVLSDWILYDRDESGDVNKRRFEGAPFEHEGAKMFLTVGPVHQYWKKPPLPADDRVVVSPPDKAGQPTGATILLAGQDWTIGFAMKNGTPELQERLVAVLLERARHSNRNGSSQPRSGESW